MVSAPGTEDIVVSSVVCVGSNDSGTEEMSNPCLICRHAVSLVVRVQRERRTYLRLAASVPEVAVSRCRSMKAIRLASRA